MAKTDKKEESKSKDRKSLSTDGVISDPRFSAVYSDPRFAKTKRKDNQVKLDDRFKRILTDKEFARKASRDRVGRKIKKTAARDEIKRLYRFEGDSEEEDEDKSESDDEDEDDSDVLVKFDPARGEGLIDTSEESSSEESSEEDSNDEDEVIEEDARHLDEAQKRLDEVPTGDVTRRLAAVNLDWDHVRAIDLMATFSSFVPAGGAIERISIYPSEFGKERMEREEMEGPPKEIFGINPDSKRRNSSSTPPKNDDSNRKKKRKSKDEEAPEEDLDEEVTAASIIKEDKGEEFDSAKLRKYQLERLRYFYAIIECDSKGTANCIYKDCDGAEYEATANFFDLRFVPDDTTFDDKPRDEWTGGAVSNYKPNDFVTDALQHSKVKLTWDQDDQTRKQVVKEAFSRRDIDEMDLKAYLASSDSESEDEELRRQYREKLNLPTTLNKADAGEGGKLKKAPVGDMEVTFTSALSGDKDNGDVFETEETTIEKYQRKEKERRKKRKEKFKSSKSGDNPAEKSDEEMAEAELEVNEDLGFNDPFFDAASQKVDRKKEKKIKKEKKVAAEAASAAEREKLELIMKDHKDGPAGEKLEHYNMRNILKAEKAAKLKGKAAKRSKSKLQNAEGLQDGFEVNVKDPRFSALFENPEYAIDPTNPRFKKSNAMSKILEEKRKRTSGDWTYDNVEDDRKSKSKKRKVENSIGHKSRNHKG